MLGQMEPGETWDDLKQSFFKCFNGFFKRFIFLWSEMFIVGNGFNYFVD